MNTEKKNAIEHFDVRASEWNSLYDKPVFRQRLELFSNAVTSNLPDGSSLLDFGCGGGMISINLKKLKNYNIKAVDASSGMIENAKKYAVDNETTIDFETIDEYGNGLPSNKYDGIVCSSVIEYVKHDETLLTNLARSLKGGGHLFISIPSAHSLLGKLEDFTKKTGIRGMLSSAPDVQFANKRYTADEFAKLLQSQNMAISKITPFECPLFGTFGTTLSTFRSVGVMMLVHAVKAQ